MNTQLDGELARGRNAVTNAQISAMDQRADLIAQLHVERNVAFEL
jgi:hypothetical protein